MALIHMPAAFSDNINRVDLEFVMPGQSAMESLYSGSLFVNTTNEGRWAGLVRTVQYERSLGDVAEAFLAQLSDRRNYTMFPHFRSTISTGTTIASGTVAGYTLAAAPTGMKVGAFVRAEVGTGRTLKVTSWNPTHRVATFQPVLPLQPGTIINTLPNVPGVLSSSSKILMPMGIDWIGPYSITWQEYFV